MSTKLLVAFCLLVTVLLITGLVQAQQTSKVPRIGYLSAVSRAAITARVEAFRQGLRELGYMEGKTIFIE